MSDNKNKGGSEGTKSRNPRLHQKVKTARGRKNSSTRWLQRQLNDPYVQKAKQEGYRSRAAYKLMELNEKYKFLKPGMAVIDLGAAPGGWCQVVLKECNGAQSIALDILPMDPMAGVTVLEMDFMDENAPAQLQSHVIGSKVDMVLSDMAPNSSGNPSLDHLRIMTLVEAAADFATEMLKPGGGFVCKVWQGGTEAELLKKLRLQFTTVRHAKPAASRKDSAETFLIATGFKG